MPDKCTFTWAAPNIPLLLGTDRQLEREEVATRRLDGYQNSETRSRRPVAASSEREKRRVLREMTLRERALRERDSERESREARERELL